MIRRSWLVLILGAALIIQLPGGEDPRSDLDERFAAVLRGEAEQDFTVGLALGAGAAKGLAHIGVLQALEEAGIRIDMLAGSSMGAVVGAGYAVGMSPDSLAAVAQHSELMDVVQLLDPALFRVGILDGERIRRYLERLYGQHDIEDLRIPFAVTTVDLLAGRLYMIDKGDLSTAVRASFSVPLVFTALNTDSLLLVDGGIVEPVPVSLVREMGADYIIAVNVLLPPDGPVTTDSLPRLNADEIKPDSIVTALDRIEQIRKVKQPLNATEIAHRTFILGEALIAQYRMELTNPDIVINVDSGLAAWNFLAAEGAIRRGYEVTRATLAQKRRY